MKKITRLKTVQVPRNKVYDLTPQVNGVTQEFHLLERVFPFDTHHLLFNGQTYRNDRNHTFYKISDDGTTLTTLFDTAPMPGHNKALQFIKTDTFDGANEDTYNKTEIDVLLADKQNALVAGDNITIDPDTNVISATGGGSGNLSSDLTVTNPIGRYSAGDVIPEGTSLETVIRGMLGRTDYPTFVAPTANITYYSSTLLKVGTVIPAGPAVVAFNPGAIMLNGTKQNDRAGAASEYNLTITGATTDYNETNTSGTFDIGDITRSTKGNVVVTANVAHAEGPQPKDSDGNDYDHPLAAGTVTGTKIYEFVVPFYYGVSTDPMVVDFTGFTEDLSKKENKEHAYDTNNEFAVFAYDASYGALSKIIDPNGFDVTDGFNVSVLNLDGIDYRVYVAPYATTDTGFKYKFNF